MYGYNIIVARTEISPYSRRTVLLVAEGALLPSVQMLRVSRLSSRAPAVWVIFRRQRLVTMLSYIPLPAAYDLSARPQPQR